MTAGLIVGTHRRVPSAALTALRPHARVLLVAGDERRPSELLAAVECLSA